MDLTRFQVPAFVLKPKSYLEMTSDYVQPLDFMVRVSQEATPVQRLITITKWILCNMTQTPQKGFSRMKPYNPILGEEFYCKWDHDDSTTYFSAEQVSHHPPVSALYMENRKYNWVYQSTTAPSSTFYGNKVDMTIEGEHSLHLLNLGEVYKIEWPIIVGRGILIGTSLIEHNKKLIITCEKTGLQAKISMKKKNNDFEGFISILESKEDLFKIVGNLETKATITDLKQKQTSQLFEVKNINKPNKTVTNVADQKVNESRRVWHHVTYAMMTCDYDAANKLKHLVEEEQRKITKIRKDKNEEWKTKEFKPTSRKTPGGATVYEYNNLNLTASKEEEQAQDLNLD
jgi:hypothetical protein